MANIPASLVIGVRIYDQAYFNEWNEDDRKFLKDKVASDIREQATMGNTDEKIPSDFRNLCAHLDLDDSDDDGHVEETAMVSKINAELQTLNNSRTNSWLITLKSNNPTSVTYVYYNDTRYCVHSYELRIKDRSTLNATTKEWTVDYEPTGKPQVELTLCASMSYATYLG